MAYGEVVEDADSVCAGIDLLKNKDDSRTYAFHGC